MKPTPENDGQGGRDGDWSIVPRVLVDIARSLPPDKQSKAIEEPT